MMNLLDICKIGGSSVKKFDGTRKYIATGDIIDNEIASYELVNYNNKPSRANVEIKNSDVLFAKMKDTVKVLKANENNINNIYSTGFYCMTPNDNVLHEYLYYYFKSESFNSQKNKNCTGATQKAINNEGLKKIKIKFLPGLEEQNKIVKELSCVERLITIKNEEVNKLNLLVKSQFVEMFGCKQDGFKYPTIQFSECVSNMLKGPFGSDIKKTLYVPKAEDTYKVYIQVNAIQKDENLGDYYISKEYFDSKMYKFEVKPLDYIITCDGTLGKLLRLDDNMEKGIISASLLKITLNEKISYKYFEEVWNQYMLGELSKDIRNACLTHLPSAKVIGSLHIPLPSKELQDKYTKIVEQIDKQKFVIENLCQIIGKMSILC